MKATTGDSSNRGQVRELYGFSTFFDGSIANSSIKGPWQTTDDGDANGVTDSEKTVVLALEGNKILDSQDIRYH